MFKRNVKAFNVEPSTNGNLRSSVPIHRRICAGRPSAPSSAYASIAQRNRRSSLQRKAFSLFALIVRLIRFFSTLTLRAESIQSLPVTHRRALTGRPPSYHKRPSIRPNAAMLCWQTADMGCISGVGKNSTRRDEKGASTISGSSSEWKERR